VFLDIIHHRVIWNTAFRRLDSVSVFRWNLLSLAQSIEQVPTSGRQQSQSQTLFHDWRFTANCLVLAPSPLRLTTGEFFQLNPYRNSSYIISCLMRGWVGRFAIAAGPHQRSHSRVRVPRGSRPYFTAQIRDSPNLEGQVPVFISPRNRVAHLYPQALGFLFVAS
jgi:hypothetical protein